MANGSTYHSCLSSPELFHVLKHMYEQQNPHVCCRLNPNCSVQGCPDPRVGDLNYALYAPAVHISICWDHLWELDYDAATLNADLSANRVVHRTREPLRALNEVLQGIRADWSDNSYDSDA